MALFDSLLSKLKSSKSAKTVRSQSGRAFMPTDTATAPAAAVLVAEFDGKRGPEVSKHLGDLLAQDPAIEVYRRNEALKLSGQGNLADQLVAAAGQGHNWLAEVSADVLVWGDIAATGVLTIRFLPAASDADGVAGVFGLGDQLLLPFPFAAEFEALVRVAAVAAAQGRPHARAAEMLGTTLAPLERFLGSPPAGLALEQKASVYIALGHALATEFRVNPEAAGLERALAAYQTACGALTREAAPVAWLLAQNHRAAALQALADHSKDPQRLRGAVAAYRDIAASIERARHPNDWGLAYMRLGMTLYKLAGQDGKAAQFKEASMAFENALGVFTRATTPHRWAELMNHYGVLMMALGEHVSALAPLQQAVAAFKKALEVRRRDQVPLLWAQTTNNLGAAAFALAKRNGDQTMLQTASSCFEGAVDVYREHGQTPRVHVIEKNLQRVTRLLETRRTAAAASVGQEKGRGR